MQKKTWKCYNYQAIDIFSVNYSRLFLYNQSIYLGHFFFFFMNFLFFCNLQENRKNVAAPGIKLGSMCLTWVPMCIVLTPSWLSDSIPPFDRHSFVLPDTPFLLSPSIYLNVSPAGFGFVTTFISFSSMWIGLHLFLFATTPCRKSMLTIFSLLSILKRSSLQSDTYEGFQENFLNFTCIKKGKKVSLILAKKSAFYAASSFLVSFPSQKMHRYVVKAGSQIDVRWHACLGHSAGCDPSRSGS